jgi:hypothetical protein
VVNHVRTLLLNLPASSESPLGEYVPPGFTSVAIPGAVQQARNFLFGQQPDAAMLDYRLRQYMTMLHATELVEFVVATDPRITYMPGGWKMADFSPAPSVLPIGHDQPLYLAGTVPVAGDGRMVHSWQVTALLAGQTAARVIRRSPTPGSAVHTLSFTNGLSNEFPLDGSALLARFQAAGVVDGTMWNVDCLAMPVTDPGQVAASLGAAGANTIPYLFGAAPQEPYLTWQKLWNSNQPLPYRLGAVLLAVAARTDEARTRSS